MFSANLKNRISYKFIESLFLIILFSTSLLSLVLGIKEQRTLEDSLKTQLQGLASYIANLSQAPLILKDAPQLDSLVSETHQDPNVLYAFILGADGKYLTSQYASINYHAPRLKSILADLPKESPYPEILKVVKEKEPVLEVSVPIGIGKEVSGTVVVGMTKYQISRHIFQTIVYVVAINLGFALLLGVWLFIRAKKIIFDPVVELAEAASNLAGGDLAKATLVHAKTTGELKILIDSFNQMVSDLKKVTVSKGYMDSIFEGMINALIIVSPQGSITRTNAATEKLLGYTAGELLNRPLGTIFAEEPLFRPEEIERVFTGGNIINRETALATKDGNIVNVIFSVSAIHDRQGLISDLICVAQDITQRIRAEQALRRSEARLRESQASAHIGNWDLDLSTNKLYWSQEIYSIFGLDPQDTPPPYEILLARVEPAEREFVKEKLRAAVSKKQPYDIDVPIVRPDGERRFVNARARIDFDAAGRQAIMMVGTVQDVTARIRVEEERQQLKETLHRAEKMEALGAIAGRVAHDLNNVLGVLVGYSELLLERLSDGGNLKSYASNILKSSEKGAAIIQDLLTLARRGVAVSEVVNLNTVVENFLKSPVFEKLQANHPQVVFRTEIDPYLLNIQGSPIHLEKALMNLIANAAEAVPESGIVTVRTENRYLDQVIRGYNEIKEGDYAVLSVSDNGVGIPAAELGKIFEPFYTNKVMGNSGTGLGLSVVWGTVKDHDGYIDLLSEEGQGSAFTLYFPVTSAELTGESNKIPVEEFMGRGETILVIDDVPEQREVAVTMLTRIGYNARSVASGEEALDYLKDHRTDLLMVDMIMGNGIDGLTTYERALEINPQQKAIIVSGFSETDRVLRAQELGAGGYVRKPYILEKIGLAIRETLATAQNVAKVK